MQRARADAPDDPFVLLIDGQSLLHTWPQLAVLVPRGVVGVRQWARDLDEPHTRLDQPSRSNS